MNKKEYTIQINGLTTSVKDVTSLEKALQSLDKTAKSTTVSPKGGASGTSKTKAMTDEEKAAKRLAETQKRLTEVNNEANRAQIEATQQLRERTREVSREIALNQLAEGSIAAMGMQLTNLRNEYERLSEEERNNIDIGGQMITKIQALDEEYKGLRESTGNFRDSVGNYEKALSGLDKLDKGLGDVGNNVNALSAGFANNSALMGIFGSITATTEKAQAELAKIIALVTLAQQLSTAATTEGIVATTAKTVVDKISTAQTKAKAIAENLATKGTIAATAAQWLFNAAAYANPYVLLAMALVGLVAALVIFSDNTEDAAEAQKKLNVEQNNWRDYLDGEEEQLRRVSEARISEIQRQLDLAKAQGKSLKDIHKLEKEISNEKIKMAFGVSGLRYKEIEALEENEKKLEAYRLKIIEIKAAQARGDNKMYLDIDLNGSAKKVKVEEALDIIQNKMNGLNRDIEVAIRAKEEKANGLNAEKVLADGQKKQIQEEAKQAAEKAKQAREEAKRKADEARKNAQERASLELEAQRAAEDLRIKLMGQSLAAQRKLIEVEYDRQIQDLRIRLKQEENLSVKARQAINDQIVKLEEVKKDELGKLQDEIVEKERETAQQRQDQETALIKGMADRRIAEINIVYGRQIDAIDRQLNNEKEKEKERSKLTEKQIKDLHEMRNNYDKQREVEMDALIVEGLNRRAALEVQTAEDTLKAVQNKIGEVVKVKESGFLKGVVDPEETKKAVQKTNEALTKYISDLRIYLNSLKTAHETTITGLKKGSIEYDEEMQKYAQSTEDVAARIKKAEESIKSNNETGKGADMEGIKGTFGKIAEYAQVAAEAINMVTDTLNQGLQASIDALNEQLDEVNEKYDKAKELHEKAAADVEATEEKMRNASGATADALRDQLQNQMHARDEAAREEQRQAKEKEKLEAEIKKKEKQMKRNELMGKIAMGIANVAQAVTVAFTAGPILGIVMAGITAAMGAVQIGIMTKQLSKLAKGGPIVGPSHDNGGVNILIDGKPSYEAQGGEFMVNVKSYSSNKALTEFLNASPDTLTAADLVGIVPGFDALPVAVSDISSNSDDRVVEAINDIEFNPVVSVTDIIDVTDEVTTVRDLAGV